MNKIIVLILLCAGFQTQAQELFKDKLQTIAAINQKGYTITYFDSENYFSYKRYDEYDESRVYVFFEGNLVRKAVFSQDFGKTSQRFKDVYAQSPRGVSPDNMITSNTIYYDGRAKYDYEREFKTDKNYYFTIIVLD